MKKIAKMIKDHVSGKKTASSKTLIKKVSSMLKEQGFKGPFKIVKISGEFIDQGIMDLEGAYRTLGINPSNGVPSLSELDLVKNQKEEALKAQFFQKGSSMESFKNMNKRMELVQDAYDFIINELDLNNMIGEEDLMEA